MGGLDSAFASYVAQASGGVMPEKDFSRMEVDESGSQARPETPRFRSAPSSRDYFLAGEERVDQFLQNRTLLVRLVICIESNFG